MHTILFQIIKILNTHMLPNLEIYLGKKRSQTFFFFFFFRIVIENSWKLTKELISKIFVKLKYIYTMSY